MSSASTDVLSTITAFCDDYPEVSYRDGEILIQAENDPPGIFFLQTGHVVQIAPLLNGDRLIVNYYHSPAFFPIIWAFGQEQTGKPLNRHEFVASGKVIGCWAPINAVTNWLPKHPAVLMDLLARLSRGFDATLAKWEEAHQSSALYLVGQVITRHAERLGTPDEKGAVSMQLTHQEIADQAGVTRETASRILSQLASEGLISTGYRKITIPHIPTLQAWLTQHLELSN